MADQQNPPTGRFRLIAGSAVILYWGALSAAHVTKGGHWVLHLLWAYPFLGATVWSYIGAPPC